MLFVARAIAAGAAEISLERSPAPPPSAASPVLRRLVDGQCLRVTDPGKLSATFWLRSRLAQRGEAPSKGSPVLAEGIAIRGIPAAAFVGLASFDVAWFDYRGRIVKAGLYTMRYLVQPATKDHKGVSALRDFLILTPAGADIEADVDPRDLIGRSAAAAGSGHPVVMALFPLPDPATVPAIFVNALGQPMAGVRIGSNGLGIVLEGHGRIDEP
jgi:hypothetical protein